MYKFSYALVLLVFVIMPWAWGKAAPADPAKAASIEQWIERLGNRDYRVREEASKALISLGAPALPALQKARTHTDAEVQRRLDELIDDLQRVIALTPKPITLHLVNKPLKDILAEMAKQTGYKIPATDARFNGPDGKKLYTFHFDKLPFWKALETVCEVSGLSLQHQNGNDDTIRVAFQDSYSPFHCFDGSFKVLATGFTYQRNSNIGQIFRNPFQIDYSSNESLQLNLMIAVEPRLPIMKVGQVKLSVAEDEEQRSMVSVGNPNYYPWQFDYFNNGMRRSFCQNTSAQLSWPSKATKTLRRIKGIVPVTLLAEQRPTTVVDNVLSAKGKKLKVGTATFNIDDVSPMAGGKQHQIKVSFSEEVNDTPWDYSRIQSVQQRVEIHDAKGNKYPAYVRSFQFNSPTNCTFTLTTQENKDKKIGPPSKLIYLVWVQMEHEVGFEFKDLPLP